MPLNVIPQHKLDPLALAISKLYHASNVNGNGFNFLSNPVRSENRNNFDIRLDQKYTEMDYVFFRFTYENQPSYIQAPFTATGQLGGGFFSDVKQTSSRILPTT